MPDSRLPIIICSRNDHNSQGLVVVVRGERSVELDVEEIYYGIVRAGFVDDDFYDVAVVGREGDFQGGDQVTGGGFSGHQFQDCRVLAE